MLGPWLLGGLLPGPSPVPSGPAALVVRGSSTVPSDFSALDDIAGTLFGMAVAVDGDLALVGAPGNAGAAPGVVHVLRREATGEWTAPCMLMPPSGEVGNFGAAVALLGTEAVIGEPRRGTTGAAYLADLGDLSSCPSPTPLPLPGGLARAGTSVAISARWIAVGAPGTDTTTGGGRVAVLDRMDPMSAITLREPERPAATGNLLGWSVAVAEDLVLAGAPKWGDARGAAWIFAADRSSGTAAWGAGTAFGVSPGAGARYGTSVALSRDGTLAAVGAPQAVVEGSPSRVGAVLTFARASSSATWPASGSVVSAEADGAASDGFGTAVAIDGPHLLVGAPYVDLSSTTKDTDEGVAYLFARRDGGYVRLARYQHDAPLSASRTQEWLGFAVALSGAVVVLGAPGEGAPGLSDVVGLALAFAVPAGPGEACTSNGGCESGVCGETAVCCERACVAPCEVCDGAGLCAPANDSMSCTTDCDLAGTCSGGACVAALDAACALPDAGAGDAGMVAGQDVGGLDGGGRRAVVRVSGCKCEVGGRGGSPLASLLAALLVLGLLRRRDVARWRAALGLVAVALGLFAVPAPARAQEASEATASDAEVQVLLGEALREFEGGNYTEAYALFRRLHEVAPSARTARGLGNTAFELRRYAEAIDWLEQSLADGRRPLTDELRAQVEALLVRARAFVGHFTLRASVPEAQITIDGELVSGESRSLEVGEHTVEVRAAGHEPLSRRLTVRGGEDEVVELVMIPSASAGVGAVAVEARASPLQDAGIALLVAAGVTGIGGAVASALWATNVAALNANLEAGLCSADPATESVVMLSPADTAHAVCLQQQNFYRTALPFAWAGFGAAAVLLGTGLGLLLAPSGEPDGEDASEPATALRCGPFAELGVSCTGTF